MNCLSMVIACNKCDAPIDLSNHICIGPIDGRKRPGGFLQLKSGVLMDVGSDV